MDAKGHASGKLDDLAVQADVGADLAAKGYSSGHITAKVDATGLPAAPHATINADGTLLDAPLSLALTAEKSGDTFKVDISQASWKSLHAGGTASLTPPALIPAGSLHLDLGRLADLEPLLGRPIAGQANATLDSDDKVAKLSLTVRDAALPGTATVSKMMLNATVTDPTGHPAVDGTFTADGVSAGDARSVTARVTAKGPIDALGITVAADAPDLRGSPAKIAAAGTLNAADKTLALARMEASWKQQVLRLLAPAKFNFAEGVAMDRLRLGFRQAELTVSGSAGSKLDLTATLRNLPADIGAVVNPAFAADGVIAADARLTGTSARPEGTIKLTATGVRQRQGPGQALPAANLAATIILHGTSAQIDTRLTAGPSHVSVTGSAPLSAGGALDLKTDGHVDLAMLDPLLTAEGRRARGEVNVNATVAGSMAAPRVTGTAQLSKGDVTDYTLGAHVTDLAATIQATGETIRLAQFSGKAGPGTLGGNGSISLAGAMPVDLHFTANDARPVSSDLMTALIDANLTIQGEVKGDLQVGGTLHIRRADIQIPDKLPASVAVLPVRDANTPPPPPPAPEPHSTITLNLTLSAPEQVFIRGRGLSAELGGTIHIHGTLTKPIPDGGFHLRQGTLSIIGTTLNFTEGSVTFSGAGLTDPSIHFVATSTTATIVATLTVSGTARNPEDHVIERARHAAGRDPLTASVQHQHIETQPAATRPDRRRAGLAFGCHGRVRSAGKSADGPRARSAVGRQQQLRQSDASSRTIPHARRLSRGPAERLGDRNAGDGPGGFGQRPQAADNRRFRFNLRDRQHQQRGRGQRRDYLSVRILNACPLRTLPWYRFRQSLGPNERVIPCPQFRMAGAPCIVCEAEIQIAKSAGNRDGADVDVPVRRIRFQDVDRPADGSLEPGDLGIPRGFPRLALLTAAGDSRVENSVTHGLELQRPPPRRTVSGE